MILYGTFLSREECQVKKLPTTIKNNLEFEAYLQPSKISQDMMILDLLFPPQSRREGKEKHSDRMDTVEDRSYQDSSSLV